MTRSFVDSTLLFGETAELRARLQSDGYLLLRNIVPSDALDVLRSSWQDILETTTWLDPSSAFGPTTLRDGVFFNPIDENYRVAYHQVFALEALHALPHHSTIVHLVERLFGEPSLQLPVVVPRMIFPRLSEQRDMTSPAHQDFPYNQGSERSVTVWTPILDCPIGSGTLELLPRSHKNGVRPFRPSAQNGGLETICGPDEEWVTGDMRPGDLLIFGCLTVHRGAPNISRTFRLCVDFRFQPLSEPACANGFESGSDAENWDTIYSRWTTDSLKYYWRALDPTLVPFDDSYANTRDAQAIALGEAGDATALAGLRRAAGTSRSASVRRKASELLRALTAFDRDPK